MRSADGTWLKRSMAIGAFVALVAELAYRARYGLAPVDEAYVYFRVAENFAQGAGPVFNPGERVEVTPSPLWTLLLGALGWLGAPARGAASYLGLGATVLSAAATAVLGQRCAGRFGALAAPLLLVAIPSLAARSGSSVETPLAVLGFACAAASMLSTTTLRGVLRTALICGFLPYVRFELLACAPSLIGLALLSLPPAERRRALRYGAACWAAPLVLLLLARYAYFGAWLPEAGAHAGNPVDGLRATGRFLLEHAAYTLLAVVAVVKGREPSRGLALVLANFFLVVLFTGPERFGASRLALPALPLVVALAVTTLVTLAHAKKRALAAATAFALQFSWALRPSSDFRQSLAAPLAAEDGLRIGEFLSSLPRGTVASAGTGALGYYERFPILDLLRAGPDSVLSRSPDYVLALRALTSAPLDAEAELRTVENEPERAAAGALLRDPRFLARYTPRNYAIGDSFVRLWLREDLARTRAPSSRVTPAGTYVEAPSLRGVDGRPSAGCAGGAKRQAGQHSLTIWNRTRTYHVVPARVSEPVPLVLDFHGSDGSGALELREFRLSEASGGKAVMILPDGVKQDWYGGFVGWDPRSNYTLDLAFARALIEQAVTEHCIDTSRIYAIGFSWGGWMANQLGCAFASSIRAVVSIGGGGPSGPCTGPVSALVVHAPNDPFEPILEGKKSLNTWRDAAECAKDSSPTGVGTCAAFASCRKPVWWCEHTEGHTLPESVRRGVWGFLSDAP